MHEISHSINYLYRGDVCLAYALKDELMFELDKSSSMQLSERVLEKKGVQLLLKTMFQGSTEVSYEPSGRPYLIGDSASASISISHSKNYIALASSSRRIGIDIEEINERVLRVRSRFLNSKESEMINATDLELNTCAWCMKEALFKLSKSEGLNFKTDLLILEEIESRKKFRCAMKEDNQLKEVYIEIIRIDDMIIAFNV